MSSPITTGSLPKLMRPGLFAIFGDEYAQYPDEWTPLFNYNVSNKNYEEMTMTTFTGLAQLKPQGSSVSYDDIKQAFTSRFTHDVWGLGFVVTMEEVADNLYMDKAEMRTKGLAFSMKQTKNINAANIFNRGFTSATGGDGAYMLGDHPTESGNQSNILTVAAELSEASLEELLLQVYDCRDNRNKKIALTEQALVIPYNLQFEATRILKNPERPATADRDINAMNTMGKFPKGIVVNHYFTDSDAWFITTSCPMGLMHFERDALRFDDDNDFDTNNLKFKAIERYSFGWADWRGVFGSPGA